MTFLYDVRSLLGRYLKKLIRNPTLLATNLLTPLAFLFLFSQLLQKLSVFPGITGSYLEYLTPGIIVLNSMVGATLSGVSMVNDLNSGFLSKMLLTQVSRAAILLGRMLTDVLVVLAQTFITIVFALILGITIATGVPGLLVIVVLVTVFELALSGIFLVVGMRTRKTETISAIGNAVFFPLVFVSSAMFPTSFFPTWAQDISYYNPVSYAADIARGLIQGGLSSTTFVTGFAYVGAIAIATIAATLYEFRRVVS